MSDDNGSPSPPAPPPADAHPVIPGMRAMAIVRWALLALVAVITLGTWVRFVALQPHADNRPARYYCPMHPQIRSPDPGTCPICYMNLEPIPQQGAQAMVTRDGGVADAGSEPLNLAPVMLTLERRQRAGIAVVRVRRVTIDARERWPATVRASEGARAEVRVRAGAFVEHLAIREANVQVRAGQPLAWVYSPEILRAQEELLLVARSWHSPEGAELTAVSGAARERLRLLGVSDADVDAIVRAGRSQRRVPVRAPISGYVTRFEAVVGSFATPEMVLYEITDLSRVRVIASPFASPGASLAPGTVAAFHPRDGREPIPLALELVEPAVSADTRALRVRFAVTSATASLRPDEIGEVIVERAAREVLVVPRDALIDTGAHRYIFVERAEGLFEPREVAIGELYEEHRVVTSGLSPGERIVARGAFLLDSESRLQAALAPARDGGTAMGGMPMGNMPMGGGQ